MGIEFDAASNSGHGADTSHTHAHSTGSGAFRHIQVNFSMAEAHSISGTPTYGGENLVFVGTDINTTAGGIRTYLYHLVDPKSGANNVYVEFTGGVVNVINVVTRTGVDPNNPLGTPATADGAGGAPTINVTSGEGELVIDSVGAVQDDPGTLNVGANQTLRVRQATTGSYNVTCGISDELGQASVTMSWTATSGNPLGWAIVAVPLTPYVSERDRLIKYFANTFDPPRRLIDNQGRDVPRSLLKTDEYFRNEGPFVITARKPASLLQEKSVGYIETVSFQEGRDVSIETVTETMLESLFRRLGGSAA